MPTQQTLYSQKLYRVSHLKNYLIQRLDGSQTVKRLCRYLTTTPLLTRGYQYDGKLIQQPDLVDSLLYNTVKDQNASIKEETLIPYAFAETVLNDRKLSIFVHCPYSTFNLNAATGRGYSSGNDDVTGKHRFMIEVIYPIEYDRLEPFGEERALLLGCEILNLIDSHWVEGDIREIVGDCQFKVQGEVSNLRLSTSGYMILSIPVWTSVLAGMTEQPLD